MIRGDDLATVLNALDEVETSLTGIASIEKASLVLSIETRPAGALSTPTTMTVKAEWSGDDGGGWLLEVVRG